MGSSVRNYSLHLSPELFGEGLGLIDESGCEMLEFNSEGEDLTIKFSASQESIDKLKQIILEDEFLCSNTTIVFSE